MELDQAKDFLRQNHRSVLMTRRSDGSPQASPVVHGVDEAGRVLISSREPAYKVRNLRRDGHASLCAFTDGFFGKWVQVDGTATILSLPEAMDTLVELYRLVAGEHSDWEKYRAAMETERRVIIAIDAERAGPDHSG